MACFDLVLRVVRLVEFVYMTEHGVKNHAKLKTEGAKERSSSLLGCIDEAAFPSRSVIGTTGLAFSS